MSRSTLGTILLVVGLTLVLVGLLTGGFGPLQIAALVLGIILIIAGLVLLLGRQEQPASAAPQQQPKAAPAPAAGAASSAAQPAPGAKDDLTRVEGIGPKIQSILQGAGISTFAALAQATPGQISEAITAADFKAPFDAASWPQQAALAARGDWQALDELQANLKGGRS